MYISSIVFVNTVCLAMNNVEAVHFQPEVKYFQELKRKYWSGLPFPSPGDLPYEMEIRCIK